MTRLKLLLLGILRKMGQSRRSKHQNTARNEHYTMAKSRRFCRGLRCILRVKKWRRSENFDGVGILRIYGVTARSHIRLPTSTFTRCWGCDMQQNVGVTVNRSIVREASH